MDIVLDLTSKKLEVRFLLCVFIFFFLIFYSILYRLDLLEKWEENLCNLRGSTSLLYALTREYLESQQKSLFSLEFSTNVLSTISIFKSFYYIEFV